MLRLLPGKVWGSASTDLIVTTTAGQYGSSTQSNFIVGELVSSATLYVSNLTNNIFQSADHIYILGGGFGSDPSAVSLQISGLVGHSVAEVLNHQIKVNRGSLTSWGSVGDVIRISSITIAATVLVRHETQT